MGTTPETYPPLPGSGVTPPTGGAAPAATAAPAAKPPPRTPVGNNPKPPAMPTKVLSQLPGAPIKTAPPGKVPGAPTAPERREMASAQVRATPPSAGGGMEVLRGAAPGFGSPRPPSRDRERVNELPAGADEFAAGKQGGLARYDTLRDRLRKDHHIAEDDPLFPLISTMEEMELGLISQMRLHRKASDDLIVTLEDSLGVLAGISGTGEQSTRLLSDLTDTLRTELMPLLIALRDAPKPVAPEPAPVPAPAPAKLEENWWLRLGRAAGFVRAQTRE